jgi:hypothetical protein
MKFKALGTAALLCSFVMLASAEGPKGAVRTTNQPDAVPAAGGIQYHGGPVLATASKGPVHLYLIFYGNWSGTDPGGPALMQGFASSLQGSPYWNIFTTYPKPSQIQNAISVAGTVTDTGSQGTQLNDSTLQLVVQKWIGNATFPTDSNALYIVLASQEVNETSGWCTQYCGFHNFMTYNGKSIKYSFIGNPAGCTAEGGVRDCQGLSSNYSKSPNNDPGVDAMISVIAHETGETVTDPNLNAWFFSTGSEEGDQCAYKYGTTHPLSNGSVYNVTLGGKNYLIQQSWEGPGSTSGQKCALSYP